MTNEDLLFGIDKTEGIVAIEVLKEKPNYYQQFQRTADGLKSSYHVFYPGVWTNAPVDIPDVQNYELLGDNHFKYFVSSERRNFQKSFPEDIETYSYRYQSLPFVQSGKTLFKGMEFDDVIRLYLDIEVYTTPGYKFPSSSRRGDKIIMVSLLSNKGYENVLVLNQFASEGEMLSKLVDIIWEIDPDVIVGHNIFKFDLPYIAARCKNNGVAFTIGRNNSEPYFFDTEMKLAERSVAYTNPIIFGRHVIDTMYLAMQIDVVKREMPGYGLKELAKYIGKVAEDRVYIEGSDIGPIWDGSHPSITVDKLVDYAFDDVEETRELDKKFGASYFFASQFTPMGYQDVFRLGTETSITGIFLREYYRQGYSIPLPEPSRKYGGGFAGHNFTGHLKQKAIGIDIESQYPSLGDELNINLPKDTLKIYKPILQTLKTLRVKYKTLAKAGGEKAEMYDAQQSIYKIYLNTMSYGVLGSGTFPFNYFDGAELITVNGQNVLKCMMAGIEMYGGMVVKFDTDGILCTYPDGFSPEEFLDLIQQHLTIEIKNGHVFQRSLHAT